MSADFIEKTLSSIEQRYSVAVKLNILNNFLSNARILFSMYYNNYIIASGRKIGSPKQAKHVSFNKLNVIWTKQQ